MKKYFNKNKLKGSSYRIVSERGKDLSSNIEIKDGVIELKGNESFEQLSTFFSKNEVKSIVFSNCFLNSEFYNFVASIIKGKNIEILFSVPKGRNADCIFDEKQTQILADNANIFISDGHTVELYSKAYGYKYPLQKVLEANRKLEEWTNLIKNAKVDGRELSPLEKYLYAYITVSNFYDYKKERTNESPIESRALVNVLTGDKIVCVGYAEMLITLLNRLGIPAIHNGVKFENNSINHATCLVYLKDDIYNFNSIFYSDPTSSDIFFSMLALKDFKECIKNITFIKNSFGSDGKISSIKDFLKAIKDLPKEDYEIMHELLIKSMNSSKGILVEDMFIDDAYETFYEATTNALLGKEFSDIEKDIIISLNYQTFDDFRNEVLKYYEEFKESDNFVEKIMKKVLKNEKRTLFMSGKQIEKKILELNSEPKFNIKALENVFKAMGKSEDEAKSYTSAIIAHSIEVLFKISQSQKLYGLDLTAPTNNEILNMVINELNENPDFVDCDEAERRYQEARYANKAGKVSNDELKNLEEIADFKLDLDCQYTKIIKYIKAKIQSEVMDKSNKKPPEKE